MYGGPDLAAAAQGSSPTCGHLLHVIPVFAHPVTVISHAVLSKKVIKDRNYIYININISPLGEFRRRKSSVLGSQIS